MVTEIAIPTLNVLLDRALNLGQQVTYRLMFCVFFNQNSFEIVSDCKKKINWIFCNFMRIYIYHIQAITAYTFTLNNLYSF